MNNLAWKAVNLAFGVALAWWLVQGVTVRDRDVEACRFAGTSTKVAVTR